MILVFSLFLRNAPMMFTPTPGTLQVASTVRRKRIESCEEPLQVCPSMIWHGMYCWDLHSVLDTDDFPNGMIVL